MKTGSISRMGGVLAAGAILLAGCGEGGPPLAEAGGSVAFNGRPLAGADVIFSPEEGPTAVGKTDESGRFELFTNGRPGALIGKHKVAIQAVEGFPIGPSDSPAGDVPEEELEGEGDLTFGRRWLIPKRYGNSISSGLTAEVSRGSTDEHEFELLD